MMLLSERKKLDWCEHIYSHFGIRTSSLENCFESFIFDKHDNLFACHRERQVWIQDFGKLWGREWGLKHYTYVCKH